MTRIFGTNKGYIFHEGKIKFINITAIDYDNESLIAEGKLGGEDMRWEIKNDDDIPIIYKTEEDCANHVECNGMPTFNFNRTANVENKIGDIGDTCYIIGDNGIQRKNLYSDDVHLRIIPKKRTDGNFWYWETFYPDYEKVFGSYKDAEAYSEIEVIEDDGSKHIRPSLVSRIKLTEEQQKLWSAFKDAYQACKDAHIEFFTRTYYNDLYAINSPEDIETESYVDDYEDYFEAGDVAEHLDFVNNSFDYDNGSENGIFVRFAKK